MHATKAYGGMELEHHSSLTSVQDEDEWSASRTDQFTPMKVHPVPIEH